VNVRAVLSNPRAVLGASILAFFIVIALLAPVISPYSPTDINFPIGVGPSWKHWLGTTAGGQDILSQLIWGTRASVSVGLGTGALICHHHCHACVLSERLRACCGACVAKPASRPGACPASHRPQSAG